MASIALEAEPNKPKVDEKVYRQRIRAWTMYDWANSAFATTIMAALLPPYFSTVAGSTLPSAATATAYWGLTGSFSLFIVALLSPILGTISDVMRGKKLFLTIFVMIGVIGTGLLVFVNTGDWLLASLLFVIGRIGFAGANVFYDALLPHVAREEDRDRVSMQGFAFGYLGGGILLAINVAMFMLIPDSLFENAGVRLSFLSVAIWWLLFSIPIFRTVPEPPSDSVELAENETLLGVSFKRLRETFADLSQYSELFKYLIAFLIYNDGIGTIISIATIYGAELGFGLTELVLALLLVQFVGIPFSLIFGTLPESGNKRQPFYVAFIVLNLIAMPTIGIIGLNTLDMQTTGARPAPYETTGEFLGQGVYAADDAALQYSAGWTVATIAPEDQVGVGMTGAIISFISPPAPALYAQGQIGETLTFDMNGQRFDVRYAAIPEGGTIDVRVNGDMLMNDDEDDPQPILIDTFSESVRYGETQTITLPEAGQYTVELTSNDGAMQITSIEVLEPQRVSNLGLIIGLVFGSQIVLLGIAWVTQNVFKPLADWLDTRRSILLALVIYGAIAVWGFVLDSTIEYWFLAWMVAVVQGGSQGLSRSLYASMCPTSKSGEFFGLFSIMSKFAAIIGPLLFAGAVAIFGSSRPAILSLIALFAIGGFLLTRVNIAEGQRIAKEEDRRVYGTAEA